MYREFLPFDMLQNYPEMDWLVDGLLPLGYTAILASEPKAGKTCLATAIALAVGTGQDFAGLRTAPGNVLWFSLEETAAERRTILHQFQGEGEPPQIFTSHEPIRIDDEETYVYLHEVCREFEPKLIVIDPLYAAISGYSLREAHQARRSLTLFKQFCNAIRATGLVLHHLTNSGPRYHRNPRVAESAQLAATASMQILLTQYSLKHASPSPPSPSRVVCLECRGRGPVNRRWRFTSNGPLDYREGDPDLAPPRTNTKVTAILNAIEIGYQRAIDIIEFTKLRPSTVRNLLASLLANNEITVTKVEDKTRFYALPASTTPI